MCIYMYIYIYVYIYIYIYTWGGKDARIADSENLNKYTSNTPNIQKSESPNIQQVQTPTIPRYKHFKICVLVLRLTRKRFPHVC